MMYESFQLNYKKYFSESHKSAQWLVELISKYKLFNDIKVLDWGCGPGRIVRHLPELAGQRCEFFATDYNPGTINWCKNNLPGIHFNVNTLEAGLPYRDGFFDIIYGLSVFTHLSEKKHYQWYDELKRILKRGGILLITTQGANFSNKLMENESKDFNNGDLVVRGKVKEGHRTFSAFHPKEFMYRLFENSQVLCHIERPLEKGKGIPQDVWIVRKQ